MTTDPTLDNRQEFVAVGAASIAGSFFQTVPAAGGFSQTLVNVNAGAASQVSELVTAGLAVVVALFLAPVLSDLPQATLGAIVLVAIAGLIDFKALARVWRIDRVEFTVAVGDGDRGAGREPLVGVAVGVAMTFYLVLRAINHPVVIELQRPASGGELEPLRDGDTPVPGLLVLRIEGMMYTMNVHNLQTEILPASPSAIRSRRCCDRRRRYGHDKCDRDGRVRGDERTARGAGRDVVGCRTPVSCINGPAAHAGVAVLVDVRAGPCECQRGARRVRSAARALRAGDGNRTRVLSLGS